MKTKVIDALVIFSVGVVSVLLLALSMYFGAIDACATRGFNTAVIGEHGIYCINHEVKKTQDYHGSNW